jgi:hypothetical protein
VRGTNGTAGFKGDGHPEFFLIYSIPSALDGLPAELWLTVLGLRQLVVRGRLKRVPK